MDNKEQQALAAQKLLLKYAMAYNTIHNAKRKQRKLERQNKKKARH